MKTISTRWGRGALVLAFALAVSFTAKEAVASGRALREDCSQTSWCVGTDPDENCNLCCQGEGGLCYSYEQNIQGCLCY
jgi:hypothetical protein